MLSDVTMRVSRDGKPAGILASTVPLQVGAANGPKRLTDLTLARTRVGFEPASPVTPILIGRDVGDGIRLPSARITVTPLMPRLGTQGTLLDGRIFYPDAAVDSDVIVGASPGGAAVSYQLRSPRSPSSLDLGFGLPAGASLRIVGKAPGRVEVVRRGKAVAVVEPPRALDAQGQAVPSRYVVHGGRLRVLISHKSGDYAYPILVDPVVDAQFWQTQHANVTQWFYTPTSGRVVNLSTSGAWGGGLYSVLGGGNFYSMGDGAKWRYPIYGDAYAYAVHFYGEQESINSPYQAVCMTVGLVNNVNNPTGAFDGTTPWTGWDINGNPSTGTGARTRCNTFSGTAGPTQVPQTQVCVISSCNPPASHAPNYPEFQQWAYGDAVRNGWNISYVGGAWVLMDDPEAPSIAGAPPTEADGPSTTMTLTYWDQGLGAKRIQLSSPGNPNWDNAYDYTSPCPATNSSPCPALGSLTRSFGNLPGGDQTIRFTVTDAAGHPTVKDYSVWVDFQDDPPDSVSGDDPADPSDQSGGPTPTLTDAQRDQALNIISNDPTTQQLLAGKQYQIDIGPWTEDTGPDGGEVLVGAAAQITFTSPQSWSIRSWPVTDYADPSGGGNFTSETIRASASNIARLDVDVDFAAGEVAGAFPDTSVRNAQGDPANLDASGQPRDPSDPEVQFEDPPPVPPSEDGGY